MSLLTWAALLALWLPRLAAQQQCAADRWFVASRGTCDAFCRGRRQTCAEACDTERGDACGCEVAPWDSKHCGRSWVTRQCRCAECADDACRARADDDAAKASLLARLLGPENPDAAAAAFLDTAARARLVHKTLDAKDFEAAASLVRPGACDAADAEALVLAAIMVGGGTAAARAGRRSQPRRRRGEPLRTVDGRVAAANRSGASTNATRQQTAPDRW